MKADGIAQVIKHQGRDKWALTEQGEELIAA